MILHKTNLLNIEVEYKYSLIIDRVWGLVSEAQETRNQVALFLLAYQALFPIHHQLHQVESCCRSQKGCFLSITKLISLEPRLVFYSISIFGWASATNKPLICSRCTSPARSSRYQTSPLSYIKHPKPQKTTQTSRALVLSLVKWDKWGSLVI